MSTATTQGTAAPVAEPQARGARRRGARPARPSLTRALIAYAVGSVGAGLLAGVLWRAIVKLPTYRLDDSQHALISEQGLAAIFSIDAWFACMGLGAGLILGLGAWVFFRRLGWPAVLIALAGVTIAGLTCWGLGSLLGPGPLGPRLASAHVGDLVPVDFQLHAHATLAVWPFGAMIPLLLLAAVAPDPETETETAPQRAAMESAADGGNARTEQVDEGLRSDLDLEPTTAGRHEDARPIER